MEPNVNCGGTSEDEALEVIKGIAQNFRSVLRSPILRRPSDYGLEYEEISFPSQDGVPLEGWFIPCADSDKIIIANHPRNFNRSGFPSHVEPYKSMGAWADPGNATEVNFIPDFQILHEAGYNILTYDMRNFGLSGEANGGMSMNGRFESRDVIGSLQYVRGRRDTKHMTIGLFSRCLGCSATFFAMHTQPEQFKGVRCLLAPQPISAPASMRRALEVRGVQGHLEDLDREIRLVAGYGLDDFTPQQWAKSVMVPAFLYGVKDDPFTYNEDLLNIFDNIPVEDKKFHWITGTRARWDGYKEFQSRPAPMLEWLAHYMSK